MSIFLGGPWVVMDKKQKEEERITEINCAAAPPSVAALPIWAPKPAVVIAIPRMGAIERAAP